MCNIYHGLLWKMLRDFDPVFSFNFVYVEVTVVQRIFGSENDNEKIKIKEKTEKMENQTKLGACKLGNRFKSHIDRIHPRFT